MDITLTARRQKIMMIQKLFCTKTMSHYFQVSGRGPIKVVIVEDQNRTQAIEAWTEIYERQLT
jgi:hypothetical protein